MPSGLIGKANRSKVLYDSVCPECGSDKLYRTDWSDVNAMPDFEDMDTVSPWCHSCRHGWVEKK